MQNLLLVQRVREQTHGRRLRSTPHPTPTSWNTSLLERSNNSHTIARRPSPSPSSHCVHPIATPAQITFTSYLLLTPLSPAHSESMPTRRYTDSSWRRNTIFHPSFCTGYSSSSSPSSSEFSSSSPSPLSLTHPSHAYPFSWESSSDIIACACALILLRFFFTLLVKLSLLLSSLARLYVISRSRFTFFGKRSRSS